MNCDGVCWSGEANQPCSAAGLVELHRGSWRRPWTVGGVVEAVALFSLAKFPRPRYTASVETLETLNERPLIPGHCACGHETSTLVDICGQCDCVRWLI